VVVPGRRIALRCHAAGHLTALITPATPLEFLTAARSQIALFDTKGLVVDSGDVETLPDSRHEEATGRVVRAQIVAVISRGAENRAILVPISDL